MMNIPSHLYHPLVVHFPIAFLMGATVCYLISFIGFFHWLRNPSIVMGVMGSIFGFIAKQTGEMAEKVIETNFCNLELLAKHSSQAETAIIFFSVTWGVAALFHLLRGKLFFPQQHPIWFNSILVFGMLMGSAYLVSAGHKGFRLVFENGAGVHSPIQYCK